MTKKRKQSPFIKGHYYAAKYRSKNSGDVIVCRIQSVRTARKTGDEAYIVSTNLITEKPSTKNVKIFARRMKRVSKTQASKILAVFKKKGKEAARETAAAAPEFKNGRNKQLELPKQAPTRPKQAPTKQQQELQSDDDAFSRFFSQAMNDLQKDIDKLVAKHRLRMVRLLRDYGADI